MADACILAGWREHVESLCGRRGPLGCKTLSPEAVVGGKFMSPLMLSARSK